MLDELQYFLPRTGAQVHVYGDVSGMEFCAVDQNMEEM